MFLNVGFDLYKLRSQSYRLFQEDNTAHYREGSETHSSMPVEKHDTPHFLENL